MKNKIKERLPPKKERIRFFKNAKKRFDAQKLEAVIITPTITPRAQPILAEATETKIKEIENWLAELKNLQVSENTDLDKEEIVLFLRSLFKELLQGGASDEEIRIVNHQIHVAIQEKRLEIAKLKKEARREQKKLNKKLDLKHFEGSAADKLLELVSQGKVKDVDLITTLLDRIWRKTMRKEPLIGKDFEAIQRAKEFLNKVALKKQK